MYIEMYPTGLTLSDLPAENEVRTPNFRMPCSPADAPTAVM